MSTKQTQALRLLSRKRGATVEEIAERCQLSSVPAARNMITRLKKQGNVVRNIGPHRFQAAA